jgi:hypothetical protein
MTQFLSLSASALLTVSQLPLTLELKTAAVCFINDGHSWEKVVTTLYGFMDREGIKYPDPDSQAAKAMWQAAVKRATPAKCDNLLRRNLQQI